MIALDISSLRRLERVELLLPTGLTYDGISPVRIRVVKRDGRIDFSDEGGAVAAAGADPERLAFPVSLPLGEYSANVSRQGVVWLPGFRRSSDDWLAKLPGLVADGSLALYETLLDLED
jgi:hypothetical protein